LLYPSLDESDGEAFRLAASPGETLPMGPRDADRDAIADADWTPLPSFRGLLGPALLAAMLALLGSAGCKRGIAELGDGDGGVPFDAGPIGLDAYDAVFDDAGTVVGGRFHPPGYAAPTAHAPDLKQQRADCRACHGVELTGAGLAPNCDSCHRPSWRTTCTFCHGGTENTTGAPPRNLDGSAEVASGMFPAHGKHVTQGLAAGFDCVHCHVKATDVLSPGHIFDKTPGAAEVDFGTGLSRQGTYDREAGCTNLYCHGNGRGDNGSVAANAGPLGCTSCHAGAASGADGWSQMSGFHGLHLGVDGVSCVNCHSQVTTDGASILDPSLHVNGARDVSIIADPEGTEPVRFDAQNQTCTGTCHGHAHASRPWGGGGAGGVYHPAGFVAPTAHGAEMELQRQDCRGCHGQDLTGGTFGSVSTPSCDGCHKPTWRTDCVFCHGGGVNQTGAPPRDLGAQPMTVSQSFVAHPAHVASTLMRPADCTQCHAKPADVLSAGHAFDATPGKAEVDMARGLSSQSTYDGNGTCSSNYCHGNGQGHNGTYRDGSGTPGCGSCHAGPQSGEAAWGTMSGEHRKHLQEGDVSCNDCHQSVTQTNTW
jgi:predicted CxxxxCH...CXXCH cytochrome family protein